MERPFLKEAERDVGRLKIGLLTSAPEDWNEETALHHVVAYWERELGKKIRQDEVEPVTWDLYQESLKTTGAAYLVANEELQRFSRKIATWYHKGFQKGILSIYLTFFTLSSNHNMLMSTANNFRQS